MGPGEGAPVFSQAKHPDADSGVLLRAAARGDERSWNVLVDRHSGLVWAIARNHRLSAADCDEVFQTTWLRLVEHAARLHDPAKVGGWLATTARHESLRMLRRSGRQIPMGDDLPEPPQHAPGLDEDLLRRERDASLWSAFARLPERDQQLLRLLSADPAPSYEEIGAALDMPVGSIGPTRARCLERLRREAELPLLAAG